MKTFANRPTVLSILILILAHGCASQEGQSSKVQVAGDLRIWQPLTLTLRGPQSSEDGEPNPFLDYSVEATFTRGAEEFRVPGYFAADGRAADSGSGAGNFWKIHFVPHRSGEWSYEISFRSGKGIALADSKNRGQPVPPDGASGSLTVLDGGTTGVEADGLLRYVGERYLQFAGSSRYFLKSGADSPENFLAYLEFDGASSPSGEVGLPREGEAALAPGHRYEAHIGDWMAGDPTWRNSKGKGIIGALNYLASRGVNSLYFLTMNVRGDGDDVWPYTAYEERYRFDCSKLDQWNIVFDHMDRLGIMMHVVLTETENESLFEVEEGETIFADARKLYYRELVARFGHHRALVWNLGEENGWSDRGWEMEAPWKKGNTDEQRKIFADYLRALDPYDHPIVVHTSPGRHEEIYRPLLGYPNFEGPSLQISPAEETHEETRKWVELSREADRPWFVSADEIGPADTGVKPDSVDPGHDFVRHQVLWANLMAGGAGVEWYFGYQYEHNDLNLEDFRSREKMWDQTRYAVQFFAENLPFWDMAPADDWVTATEAYCFARPGYVYAVYLPGGVTTQLWLPDAAYAIRWFNPRDGGHLQQGPGAAEIRGGGFRPLGRPPSEEQEDWVALVRLAGDPEPETIPPPPARPAG